MELSKETSKRKKKTTKRQTRRRKNSAANQEDDATTKQKKEPPKTMRMEKERTEEEASQNQKRKTPAKKPPSTKATQLSPQVEAAIADFVRYSCDTPMESIRDEFRVVSECLPAQTAHAKCCQHNDRNRYPEIPCLDESRITLAPPMDAKGTEVDFVHANKLTIDKTERPFIAAQAPKDNTIEEFWRMVFQETSPALVLLCPFYEDGQQKSEEFWPLETGGYKYYGRMFINTKKVEHVDQYTIYTLEVLPEGCSNSLITRLAHCSTWPDHGISPSNKIVLRIVRWLKTIEAGPATIVSSAGTGRACTFIAIDATISKLFKGSETRVRELALEMRRQRALAIQNDLQYIFIYSTVLDYIKLKLPKYNSDVSKFYSAVKSV